MDTILGSVERIIFQNEESGFTVAILSVPEMKKEVCIVGSMFGLQPGETIRANGEWKNHLVYGQQFTVADYHTEIPAEVEGIRKYLGSGLIKGIGASFAGKIVDTFGADTFNVIETNPEKLLTIGGFGKKRLKMITDSWNDQRAIRDVMVFLQSYGVSPAYAQKIFKWYGPSCIQVVKQNPYQLARDITGIGFRSADKIAMELGIGLDAPARIDAAIEFVLHELSSEGHVCYPLEELLTQVVELLSIPREKVESRIGFLEEEKRIALLDLYQAGVAVKFVWIRSLFAAETGIAKEIARLQKSVSLLRKPDLEKALEWVQKTLRIELAANQKTAVVHALEEKMHIITGGPGTGKSTITNAILSIASKLTNRILLAAPTGRAAKRMSEITNRKALTIHSLLEFDFMTGKFKRGKDLPLECDLIIVDEASMIDTYLMYSLLKAIPSNARVIFVGDINQLPSVGPGNVLKDLIHSKSVSVTILNEIFRQAAGSRIITNAHRINMGSNPEIDNQEGSDFFFIHASEQEQVLHEIVTLVSQRLPRKYSFNPMTDIQVLAPMKKGTIGIINLNTVLQETLNPASRNFVMHGDTKFSVGDKVMQIKNNYKKEIYNGDIGLIVEVRQEDKMIHVQVDDDKIVEYKFKELDELVLSYAVSIHKYQGSECPCIVIPVHTAHFKMLTRNLLYTGVTRGKKLVILVGTTKAIGIAVRNDEVKRRYTGLQQALVELTKPPLP